eukprot:477536-Amphidinium_carterae.8
MLIHWWGARAAGFTLGTVNVTSIYSYSAKLLDFPATIVAVQGTKLCQGDTAVFEALRANWQLFHPDPSCLKALGISALDQGSAADVGQVMASAGVAGTAFLLSLCGGGLLRNAENADAELGGSLNLSQLAAHLHTDDHQNTVILGGFNLDSQGPMPRYLADYLLDAHWFVARKVGREPEHTCITPTSSSRADGLYCTPSVLELTVGCQRPSRSIEADSTHTAHQLRHALDECVVPECHLSAIDASHCQAGALDSELEGSSIASVRTSGSHGSSSLHCGTCREVLYNGTALHLALVETLDELCGTLAYFHPGDELHDWSTGVLRATYDHFAACLNSELVQARQTVEQQYRQRVLANGCINKAVSGRLRQVAGPGACSLEVHGSRTFPPTELFPEITSYWQPIADPGCSTESTAWMAQIFLAIEETACWPMVLTKSWTALLPRVEFPQSAKDLRPIRVLPTLFRLWSAQRLQHLLPRLQAIIHPPLVFICLDGT